MKLQWKSRGMLPPPELKQGDRWLFLVPHDDDAVIGAALAIQSALTSGVEVTIAVGQSCVGTSGKRIGNGNGGTSHTGIEQQHRSIIILSRSRYGNLGVIASELAGRIGARCDHNLAGHYKVTIDKWPDRTVVAFIRLYNNIVHVHNHFHGTPCGLIGSGDVPG